MPRTRHGPRVDKADRALADGQLWRAKEILASRIGTLPLDPEVFERLGRVLLQMGDRLEAGRFLLVSGKRQPEYQEAIALFVRRHSRGGWQDLLASLPAVVRRCKWSDLPPEARADLEAAGVPPRSDADVSQVALSGTTGRRPGWIAILGVLFVLVVIGFVLAVLTIHLFLEG